MMQKSSRLPSAHSSKGRVASVSPIIDQEVLEMNELSDDEEEMYVPNNHSLKNFVMKRDTDDDIYKRKLSAPHVPSLPQTLSLSSDSNQHDLEAQIQLPSSLSSTYKKTTNSSNSSLSTRGLFNSNSGDSSSSSKYAVNIGQKQQWRKSRSKQPRHTQRISSIPSLEDEQPESQVSTSRTSEEEPSTGRASSSHSCSLVSPRIVSSTMELNSPHPGMSPRSTIEEPAFVITMQKKSKYTAKILLPGQKPIYLGRFSSENGAQTACGQAFARIMTPRNE